MLYKLCMFLFQYWGVSSPPCSPWIITVFLRETILLLLLNFLIRPVFSRELVLLLSCEFFSWEMLSISVHTVRMFCKYFFKSLEFCKFWSLSVNINNILEKITSCLLGKYWDKYWCFLVSFWWDLYLLSCDILAIYNKIHKTWFYW